MPPNVLLHYYSICNFSKYVNNISALKIINNLEGYDLTKKSIHYQNKFQ